MEFDEPISVKKIDKFPIDIHQNGSDVSDQEYSKIHTTQGSAVENLRRSESYRKLQEGVEESKTVEKKCAWLRSQLIGSEVEFDTPFGKRMLTYADHTASGRCLHHIENYIVKNVLPFYGNTHTDDSFVGHRTTKMVHEAAEYIKSCMGGGPDDALLFCGSGTTAAIKRLQEVMGIAIPSIMRERVLKGLRSQERWVVFVGPYEHHSNLLSWRQSLAEVVEIGVDSQGLLDVEALSKELKSSKYANRPMLGSFSACSNVTGIYTDTRALARLLHKHGAFACFDFAASGPYVEIDMKSGDLEGYDAVFLSPHKFVGGPGTPGILLMNKALYHLRSAPPSTCGGGTVSFVNGFSEKDTLYYEDIEEREDAGTPSIVQKIRGALTFWVKEYMGYDLIDAQEHMYINLAFKRLLPNTNIEILGNTTAKRQAIISFLVYTTALHSSSESANVSQFDRMGRGMYMWGESGAKKDKPLHGRFVTKLLNDLFGIQARGGCACAGPYGHTLLNVDDNLSLKFRSAIQKGYSGLKPGWTRVNFAYYMPMEEFEFLLAAIEFIATYGQRFLPLYHFNWNTGDWTFKKRAYKEKLMGKGHAFVLDNVMAPGVEKRGLKAEQNKTSVRFKEDENIHGVMKKYTSYLESAKCIAHSLSKYPTPRRVPEDVDTNLITFRI